MTKDGDEGAAMRSDAPRDVARLQTAQEDAQAQVRHAREELERRNLALSDALALTRATLDATSDGILVTDRDRRVTGYNPQFVRIWRLPEGELDAPAFRHPVTAMAQQLADPLHFVERLDQIYTHAPNDSFDVLEFADGRVFERISRIQYLQGQRVGRVWSYRDVTERRRADEALHRQSEWLRATLSNIGDAVIATDNAGAVAFLNRIAGDLTGWTHEAAVGQPIDAVFRTLDPDTRAARVDPLRRLQSDPAIAGQVGPSLLLARDGALRPIDESIAPMRDAQDRVVGAVLVFRDATERRHADEARITLAAIVESSDDAIVSKDLDGVIRSWNRGAERLFGYTADEAIGRSITLIIPPELISEEHEILRRLRRGERIEHFETERVSKSGRRIDISLTISPVRDRDGRIVGVSKIARDVSELRRAKQTLAWDALLLANVRDAVVVIDFDGIVTSWNEGAVRLFGWTAAEAIGRDFVERFPVAERVPILRRVHTQAAATEWSGEFEARRKDGSSVWIDARVSLCADANGKPIGFLGLAHDISARRQAEETLREADRRKDEFIALLAHELRNPLAPLRNGLQVMKLAAGNAAAVEQARAMMDRQLGHMVRLVDDLLDLSRIGQNKMELRRSRIALREIIDNAVETARPAIEAAGHALTVVLPAGAAMLDADLTRMAQVFSNLLTNSAKYTETGGRISLTGELQGAQIVVTVRDTGIGIPAEALPRVFEMFSQVERTRERTSGGLGIGLALVKGLVEMHGGTVTASSEGVGRGSAFTIRLPYVEALQQSAAAPETPADEADAATSSRRILIVDDNEDAARSMGVVLQFQGNEVRTAHDGLEAVALAESFRPHAILMDVGMPRMNGYEAARRIREAPWGRSIVIVALTGWGQEDDRVQSRHAGCDAHLVKPVDLSELDRMLGELFELRRKAD